MVTLFWIMCPMIVKGVMNLFQWTKDAFKNKLSLHYCGCQTSSSKVKPIVNSSSLHAASFYFQDDDSFMVKWTHFSLNGSFLCHIPIIQPLVHLTFFRQLRILDNAIYYNHGDYVSFRQEVKTSKKDLSENVEEAYSYGRKNVKYQTEKKTLLAKFLEMKLLEAFLEAGPQFVFQIVVMLQDGITGYNQILAICTSAFSLIWASAELYLKYPTEVRFLQWMDWTDTAVIAEKKLLIISRIGMLVCLIQHCLITTGGR